MYYEDTLFGNTFQPEIPDPMAFDIPSISMPDYGGGYAQPDSSMSGLGSALGAGLGHFLQKKDKYDLSDFSDEEPSQTNGFSPFPSLGDPAGEDGFDLGGAAKGAAMGMSIGGPWGAAIGGGLGLFGILS